MQEQEIKNVYVIRINGEEDEYQYCGYNKRSEEDPEQIENDIVEALSDGRVFQGRIGVGSKIKALVDKQGYDQEQLTVVEMQVTVKALKTKSTTGDFLAAYEAHVVRLAAQLKAGKEAKANTPKALAAKAQQDARKKLEEERKANNNAKLAIVNAQRSAQGLPPQKVYKRTKKEIRADKKSERIALKVITSQ